MFDFPFLLFCFSDLSIKKIACHMQSILLKLSSCELNVKFLPSGSSFEIQILTTERIMMKLSKSDEFQVKIKILIIILTMYSIFRIRVN